MRERAEARPRVSVVVRSYNRLPALVELLTALLGQDHPSFEVVVVEQSTKIDPDAAPRLAELERDERLRVLRHRPLGGARARNVGVEAARGEIIVFIDDDDLPVGESWISAHEAAYEDDPSCLGVSGKHEIVPGEACPYRSPSRAARKCMRFSPVLRLPWTYVRHSIPVDSVDYIHGTNGSIRREAFERFGGWDTDTRIEDESSFGYRARRLMRAGEHFRFDPRPVVTRGQGTRGGLDKRFMTAGQFYRRFAGFVHRVVRRYHPWRVPLLYPLYLLAVYGFTVAWIWTDSQRHTHVASRLLATTGTFFAIPVHAARAAMEPAP